MNCPKCGSAESVVNESRMDGVRRHRRRECKKCGNRFRTIEFLEHEYKAMKKGQFMVHIGMRFWVKPAFSKGDKVGATQKAQAGTVVYVDPKCRYAVLEFEGIYGNPRESFAYSDLTEQNIVREKKK